MRPIQEIQQSRGERTVILALQGGGALGAYQMGVFAALTDCGHEPDWLSGISIGGINCALIAGNPPDRRVEALQEFWQRISYPGSGWYQGIQGPLRRWLNYQSYFISILFGQPHFYRPWYGRALTALPGSGAATSFYDTSPLLRTLEDLIDWDEIHTGRPRLTLGATTVHNGEVEWFDNTRSQLTPQHVAASGSLPPGFPATTVGETQFWDGGVRTNEPLQPVIADPPKSDTLIFCVDLWNAVGANPRNHIEVSWRTKQIQYADYVKDHLKDVQQHLKASAATDQHSYDLVHLDFESVRDEIPVGDADFSRASIRERYRFGYDRAYEVLSEAPWLAETDAGAVQLHLHQ